MQESEKGSYVETVVFKGRYYMRYVGIHGIMDLGEMRRRSGDMIQMVHGRFQWYALVKPVMNPGVP
jgi:hypothetical protein